jgi:hypothetical protein
MEVKLLDSNKGTVKLSLNSYMYSKKHEGKKEITWRCVQRHCKGALKTGLDMKNPAEVCAHCHAADGDKIALAECRQDMRRRAETSMDKPNQILATVVEQLPDAVSALLPSNDACRRTLRNIRAKHRPRDPASLDELVVTDEWMMTSGPNPRPFLLYDNGTDADERILIFTTDENLQLLANSSHWFMDGTFDIAPTLFAQLYVIHGQVGVNTSPLVYVLMQRQTQSSYEELLQFILIATPILQPSLWISKRQFIELFAQFLGMM